MSALVYGCVAAPLSWNSETSDCKSFIVINCYGNTLCVAVRAITEASSDCMEATPVAISTGLRK